MAELHVQTKKHTGSPAWVWIVVVLLIAALAYYFISRNNNKTNTNTTTTNQTGTGYVTPSDAAITTYHLGNIRPYLLVN